MEEDDDDDDDDEHNFRHTIPTDSALGNNRK